MSETAITDTEKIDVVNDPEYLKAYAERDMREAERRRHHAEVSRQAVAGVASDESLRIYRDEELRKIIAEAPGR